MEIQLLWHSPLWVCARAIRTCWDSHDKSDTQLTDVSNYGQYMNYDMDEITEAGPKDKALIERVGNKNKHSSVLRHLSYCWDITGISTKTLLAFTRHKTGVDFSVQSTRYTTSKRKEDLEFTKTGDERVDSKLDAIYDLVQEAIEEKVSDDKIAMLLPQSYQYSCVVTMNAQAIQHFLQLRLTKFAHYDIRTLAEHLAINLPKEHMYLYKDIVDEFARPEFKEIFSKTMV